MTYLQIFEIVESKVPHTELDYIRDNPDSVRKLKAIMSYDQELSLDKDKREHQTELILKFCLEKDSEEREQKLRELGI